MFEATRLSIARGTQVLVSGLSFALESDQIIAITGPTGAGKSTLLRALAGLHPIQSGDLTLSGQSFRQLGMCAWRRRVMYVSQQTPPLSGAIADFMSRASEFRALRDLQTLRWQSDAKALASEWGLEPGAWHSEFTKLSGGQRQMAYLALVLSANPSVILLDEPTSALDDNTKRRVEASLKQHCALWVTHDEDQVRRVSHSRIQLGTDQ